MPAKILMIQGTAPPPTPTRARWSQAFASGYEIHLGLSRGPALEHPLFFADQTTDGAISEDNQDAIETHLDLSFFDGPLSCCSD